MREVTKAEREKIEEVIKKIKYKVFQAEVAFASHDHSRLRRIAGYLTVCAGIIVRRLKAKKTNKRKKIRKITI